ncbi:NAD(P)/FAD-dependent oxidoreductase [Marinibacterium sp. SX1]|uniref:NAD(P)/FAD-dependent oxidoreductase n=1 Tax=Marinibacterium sp. SX1 TaxID=3388424 RepID=UPI003D16791E
MSAAVTDRAARRIAVVGAGPAGSTTAIRLAGLGYRPVIIEKAEFPREHIGESLTGEAGVLLRELGLGDFMAERGFPVKRGVRVFGKTGQAEFWVPVQAVDDTGQIIEGETWQVRRPELDARLLQAACDAGAGRILAEAREVLREGDRVTGLRLRHADGRVEDMATDMVVDASGMSTFLSRMGVCGRRQRGGYDKQAAFYAQFTGMRRDPGALGDNTMIFYSGRNRWAWCIPISETVTSIGVVVPGGEYKAAGLTPAEFMKARLADLHPLVAERTTAVEQVSPAWTASNFSYEIEGFAGPGYICVGDAHQFTDPIFSFGVSNAMQEAFRAAPVIDACLQSDAGHCAELMGAYMRELSEGQSRIRDMIDTFWSHPLAFLKIAHADYRHELAELFSGRIYGDRPGRLHALQQMQRMARIGRGDPDDLAASA